MKNGPYTMVVAPVEYPGRKYRERYVYEHQLVWWRHTGELAGDDFDVHHKNEDKRDNRPENLERLPHAEHTRHHNLQTPPQMVSLVCRRCERPFMLGARRHRQLVKLGQEGFYCGRTCGRYAARKTC